MSRVRSALVSLCLLGACRALPSAVPLADTGVGRAGDEGALGVNRVPFSQRSGAADEPDDDSSSIDEAVSIVASAVDAGDGGVSDGAVAEDAGGSGIWAGEYFGSDRHSLTAGRNQSKVALDDKAHTRVEEASPGNVVFSLVSSSDGSVICALKARATGAKAELEAGQACLGLDMPPKFGLEGKAKVDGETLELDVEASGDFTVDGDSMEIEVGYHFEGKRR